MTRVEPVSADVLRWRCDRGWLGFASTNEVEPVKGVIGQDSAVEALAFGLSTNAPGHHVFVRGIAGTGRVTLVRRMMEEIKPICPQARDRLFVRNFEQPDRPKAIAVQRGRGKELVKAIDELADFIRDRLKKALDAEVLRSERQALDARASAQTRKITEPFERELQSAGLALVSVSVGPMSETQVAAVVDGQPVPPGALESLRVAGRLNDAQAQALRASVQSFSERLGDLTRQVEEIQRGASEEGERLLQRQVRSILQPMTSRIVQRFAEAEVSAFVTAVVDDLVERRLRHVDEERDFTRIYRANLVVSHAPGESCPIVTELMPTVQNLLGTIDVEFSGQTVRSDHMMIRAGALLRADTGYLLLDARDVLSEPGAWRMLVRTLRTGRLEIVPQELTHPMMHAAGVRPEPVPINVKVVLIGDAEIYHLLDQLDPDFPHLFKVLADFDSTIERSSSSAMLYAGVLSRIVREENLPSFERDAVARLVEHGARVASRAGRLTTRFGRIGDIAREAAFVAQRRGSLSVAEDDVRSAIRRSRARADLPARRYRELIADGTVLVKLDGTAVGEVNGLAVVSAGPIVYGFPQRITATVAPGGGGVINIEREAKLSGSIHTKGFYILAGLLRTLLRPDFPLAFDASIAFEQSYGGIDGDSASGAEMICLLSALTGLPARQDRAITGAIDQAGNIMAVGAVNEKVEGFYDACRLAGFTGRQGCVVPASTVDDMMLREDVAEACREGVFRVWAVRSIHEAIELLLDRPAGEQNADGTYPPESVLGLARARGRRYWEEARRGPAVVPMSRGEPATNSARAAEGGGGSSEGADGERK